MRSVTVIFWQATGLRKHRKLRVRKSRIVQKRRLIGWVRMLLKAVWDCWETEEARRRRARALTGWTSLFCSQCRGAGEGEGGVLGRLLRGELVVGEEVYESR